MLIKLAPHLFWRWAEIVAQRPVFSPEQPAAVSLHLVPLLPSLARTVLGRGLQPTTIAFPFCCVLASPTALRSLW